MKKKDQHFIKIENRNLILDLIQEYNLISRAKLAKLASMSPTTVSRIVTSLINMGLVKETNKYTSGVGRKAAMLTLNPDSSISIGVELDERRIRFGFFNLLGKAIVTDHIEKDLYESPESVVENVKQVICRLIEHHHINKKKIIGICVGVPGMVNNKNGTVLKSAQLGWEDVEFAELMKEQVEFQVLVDNELKLKAYAEKLLGEDKTSHSIVVIGFGSGVGSALIIGNSIYRGYLNTAGEVGHTVVNPNGILCTCGNFGCLQTYIAERFLIQEASKHSTAESLEDIVNYAAEGHKWAINILERAITYAAITVNNSVCVSNPEKIILTGALIEQSSHISDKIIEASKRNIWSPLRETISIEISSLGEQGVVLGAAMLSQREHINQLSYEKELI